MSEYQQKRDFSKTTEPQAVVQETGLSRFVIQKHQASHLHWDLRLEKDGVLKSWAVPKEPPDQPGIKRLAVAVEDHPVDYIDFEGTIAEGQYGAGTVEIWDKGSYEAEYIDDKKWVFFLNGRRLTGRYALIHTRENQWLFFKTLEKTSKI
ncbi:MAG: 3'-phosphoesterase [candidate division KSB1 bacterium]|nr:3'-phosphoesterase [candidate division KSB1 bacterium]